MPLPTQPIVNDLNPERLRAILYGKPGAGKTSLAASWNPASTLLIDVDGGTRFLPGQHFIVRPKTYTEFVAIVAELSAGGHPYTGVVVDTIDKLVRMADAEAAQRHGKIAAASVEFGKGYGDRDGALMRDLGRLLSGDLGVILCAHPITTTSGPEGQEVETVFPRIEQGDKGDRLRQPIIGEFDFLLAVVKNRDDSRTLITGGDPGYETKRRVALPDTMPADAGTLHQALVAGCAAVTA